MKWRNDFTVEEELAYYISKLEEAMQHEEAIRKQSKDLTTETEVLRGKRERYLDALKKEKFTMAYAKRLRVERTVKKLDDQIYENEWQLDALTEKAISAHEIVSEWEYEVNERS